MLFCLSFSSCPAASIFKYCTHNVLHSCAHSDYSFGKKRKKNDKEQNRKEKENKTKKIAQKTFLDIFWLRRKLMWWWSFFFNRRDEFCFFYLFRNRILWETIYWTHEKESNKNMSEKNRTGIHIYWSICERIYIWFIATNINVFWRILFSSLFIDGCLLA